MKITKKDKSRKKTIIIATIIVLVLAGSGLVYTYSQNIWPFSDTSTQTTEQRDDAETDDTSTTEPNQNPNEDDTNTSEPDEKANKTPPQYTTPDEDDTNNTSNLSGVISSQSVQGDTLVIRTTINELLGSGSCQLTLTRTSDGKKVSRTSGIIQNPSTSSCKGFDIATSQLGDGTWNIRIVVKSGNKTGTFTGKVQI